MSSEEAARATLKIRIDELEMESRHLRKTSRASTTGSTWAAWRRSAPSRPRRCWPAPTAGAARPRRSCASGFAARS
eukprot:6763132-Pyramimonas_sp.AAC.1